MTYSHRVRDAAATLSRIIETPEHAGQEWTWAKIASVLQITANQARQVILLLREEANDVWWTVGTSHSGWKIKPTSTLHDRDTLYALINQERHLLTRLGTLRHAYEVLSKVDPDPRYARFAAMRVRACTRACEDSDDCLLYLSGLLIDLHQS